MLRFLTAGESHGQALVMTHRRHARGPRARYRRAQRAAPPAPGRLRPRPPHADRKRPRRDPRRRAPRRTTGAPIALLIRNRDWVNWQQTMYVEAEMPEGATGAERADVTRPRPGHADLAGAIKYGHDDIRDVLERASARETAARVAAGSLARQLLGALRRPHRQPRLGHRRRRAARRPASSRSTRRTRFPTTRRCAASTPSCSSG